MKTEAVVHGAAYVLLLLLQSIIVPNAFMDEAFHARQLERWLSGDIYSYDPMITTPPGLYLLPYLAVRCLSRDLSTVKMWVMRSANVLYTLVIGVSVPGKIRAAVMSNPLVVFYGTLYYTDVGSLAFTLLYSRCVANSGKGWIALCTLIGTTALLFRQTSIVWIGFAMVMAIGRDFRDKRARMTELVRMLCCEKRSQLLLSAGFAMAFSAFVFLNRGVALGDRQHHEPVLHIPQLFYCAVSCVLMNWPSINIRGSFRKHWRHYHALWLCPIVLSVHYCSNEHPYLFVDDRHLTNILWRIALGREEKRLFWSILYLPCLFLVYASIKARRGTVMAAGYLLAVSAAVVPSPLIEPRYYLVPAIIHLVLAGLRSRARRQTIWNAVLAALLFATFWFASCGDGTNADKRCIL